MSSPVRTDPPYVPLRHTRWPVRRTPRWLLFASAAFVAVAVLVGLAHKPSQAQRASDLRAFMTDMNSDIESCAGGVNESLTALRQLESSASNNVQEVRDAVSVATYGASNCSPADSMPIDDLEQYEVAESLASFHLDRVVIGLLNWAAPDAQIVQTDVANVLMAHGVQARREATAALNQALRKLDAQRSAVDSIMEAAIRALSAHATPPNLPG